VSAHGSSDYGHISELISPPKKTLGRKQIILGVRGQTELENTGGVGGGQLLK